MSIDFPQPIEPIVPITIDDDEFDDEDDE